MRKHFEILNLLTFIDHMSRFWWHSQPIQGTFAFQRTLIRFQNTLVAIGSEGLCYFFNDLTGSTGTNVITPTFVDVIPCNVCVAAIYDIGNFQITSSSKFQMAMVVTNLFLEPLQARSMPSLFLPMKIS